MLIGLGKNTNLMLNVKVTRFLFVQKCKFVSAIIIITFYHRAVIFYLLIGRGKDMTPLVFEFTWS